MIARRVAQAVAACDLEPASLPASAILIVRRMPDPAPRTLFTDRRHWERKARARLDELAGLALRAAYSPVPDSAAAVWFEDRAEMIACLAADLAAGRATRCWWWRIPLRDVSPVTDVSGAVSTVLRREPHLVPEVFRLLELRDALDLVLGSLADADAERLVRVTEQAFTVASAAADPDSGGQSPAPTSSVSGSRSSDDAGVSSDGVRPALSTVPSAGRPADRLRMLALALRHAAGSPRRNELLRRYRGMDASEDASRLATARPADTRSNDVEPQASAPRTRSLTVETEWGGVLYLVNVMRALGLPASIHDEIGAWALLELTGRCLAGSDSEHDALWRAMAVADGREPGTPAGTLIRDPDTYRQPVAWPRPATGAVHAQTRGHRLLLQHPMGFTVYDGPLERHPRVRIDRGRRRRARVPRQVTPTLHRLLSFVVPYVAWWLREAVGTDIDLRRVLRMHGTLRISPTHVDAVFGIDAVSLPVRMAGLDANPGWMPAFGRVITYHFQ